MTNKSCFPIRTLEEHHLPEGILRIAEQYDLDDPLGYSGDFPRVYLTGLIESFSHRRYDHKKTKEKQDHPIYYEPRFKEF
jgi:hypothetical protein